MTESLTEAERAVRVRLRRASGFLVVALFFGLDLYATGFFGGSERALAVVRSIVLPGLPFLEWEPALGIVTILAMLAALGLWLRWGMAWLPIAVMLSSVVMAATIMPLHHAPALQHAVGHDASAVLRASHEFAVVLVVFAFVARLRLLLVGMPGRQRLTALVPAGLRYPAVLIARAAAVDALAGGDRSTLRSLLSDPSLRARAARVDRWARFRWRSDTLSGAHAHLRAALALLQALDEKELGALRAEARSSLTGVIESEPTWVRPLDGVLIAIALSRLGEETAVARWRDTLTHRFSLRHGRRAAALHTPSMLGIGTCPPWEHAASTALAHREGWIGIEDWSVLRARCLGVAATGARDPDALRFVAAGELWAALTGDEEARRLLARRTIEDDALAAALRRLARAEEAGGGSSNESPPRSSPVAPAGSVPVALGESAPEAAAGSPR